MKGRAKKIVVLMGALALAVSVVGWISREEIRNAWYSLLLTMDDSRLVEYSQSEDQAKLAAVHRYHAILIGTFGYPNVETQRERLAAFSEIVPTIPEGNENAALRQMLQVAFSSVVREHLEERSAGFRESPGMLSHSRLIQQFDQFRSIEVADEDDTPGEILDAQWRDDEDLLVVGLFLLSDEVLQSRAADSLAAIGSERSLEDLGRRFLAACSEFTGGHAGEISRKQLRFALVNAIAEISGANLSTYDGSGIQGYRILRLLTR